MFFFQIIVFFVLNAFIYVFCVLTQFNILYYKGTFSTIQINCIIIIITKK